ncbi:amino acid adenylation domain-containing protein [Streptomyces sp. NPDC047123]|uniref:amino acid adenylation domain-containing protein n=1 Tax=Streptomyces sp. NPDC047123 TaxID=3155622 RepID=UPI0033C64E65
MDSGENDLLTRFAETASRHPDRVALTTPSDTLDFRAVRDRAARIAAALRARATGPGSTVGLCLPRRADLVPAMLAVWQVGAAYVPLDPAHPGERLRFLARDAGARLVLTSGGAAHAFPAPLVPVDLAALCPGPPGRRSDAAPAPATAVPALSPAYVVYTSGTTGRPKGVVVTRGNAAHLMRALERSGVYPPEPARVVWNAGLGFDASVQQWTRICRGDTLILPTDQLRHEPALFAAFLRAERATDLDATPSHWEVLRPYLAEEPAATRPLRLFLGGEPVPAGMWTDLADLADRGLVSAVNLYGPTECTVDSTAARITGCAPTIGPPLPGVRAHVLDPALRPVPEDGTGELYLSGEGVAQGYAGRAGATAERFVADPFGPPGARMYRTGDVVRRLPGGHLAHLGRSDDQVKVRGHRVEPAEIEAVLSEHPDVHRAVVVVREDAPGDRRLVAYATTAPGAGAVEPAALLAHCAARLPAPVVPSAVVLVDAFPLTPNGKTDRSALPAPTPRGAGPGRAPASAAEELLCGLFADVLGLPHVHADTDFFAAGGHSLLAMRLVGRVRAGLGAELTARDVFESPTPTGLAHRIGVRRSTRPVLGRRPRPARLPLSAAQRRLWFLDRLDGPNPTYNEHVAFRFTGHLDTRALRSAVTDVVTRHEALRTVFPDLDGEPHQHILAPGADRPAVPLRVVTEEELADALREEVRAPFDLASEPPFRAVLFAPGPNTHVLLLVMHHITSDGWSLRPLARDLAVAYRARRTGEEPDWPELPVQYADYAQWQDELLGHPGDPDGLLDEQLAYWTKTLDGMPEHLSLPVDGPRPAGSGHAGATETFTCDAPLHRALVDLARAHGCTLFMVVHAALAALLTRLGAGEDIPVGAVTAGRGDPALDDLVGFFANTLVLRTDTSGDPAFRHLLARVRDTDLAAAEHQDLPFDRLVEALNPARTAGRQPLFQVLLAFQNAEGAVWDFGDADMRPEPVAAGTAKFDLALSVTELRAADGTPAGLRGTLEYATGLFGPRSAADLLDRLRRVLETAVADPDLPLGDFDVSTARDARLLAERNDTASTAPAPTLLDLFEERADRDPATPAVLFRADQLSYGHVEARANRLARLLLERGIGAGAVVASAVPRSTDLVVAVLAVMKTGAAYLPVDPDYPVERIAHVLGDAGPALLLTCADTGLPAEVTHGLPHLRLDAPETVAALRACPSARPTDHERGPLPTGRPAYVIYTSGSTGRPKGVVVAHSGLATMAAHQIDSLGLRPSDRVLQFASPSFDAFFWELSMALSAGAALVLAPAPQLLPGPGLQKLVEDHGITHLTLPPAVLSVLSPDALRGVRTLIAAGEALGTEQVRRWAPGRTLINGYGPTETTVCASMSAPLTPHGRTAPIGRPIRDTRIHVLDARLRPAPTGVGGELYVAGAGLAHGYLNRPGTTAERFVADPFGPPGTRMYRTGDLARWNAEGELEFLGRADDQVKVRGHRIELGEIEAVLAGHPGVADVAVTVRQDDQGDRRIVAYVVPDDAAAAPGSAEDETSPDASVAAWRQLHDAVPGQDEEAVFGEDFTGWRSGYDGSAIPLDEMRQWRRETVRSIAALAPRRVLELGVGSGLLLAELAPGTEAYWGLDHSPEVIGKLRRHVAARPGLAGRVDLRTQSADDFTGIPDGHFDVVVLNSVAQYFPGGDYLTRVLRRAARALAPGGSLFVGDVRNLRLLRCFHSAAALRRTGAEPGSPAHARATGLGLAREQELLVDPAFFPALVAASDRFTSCDIRLKRGAYANELSRYRYDVVLRTAPAPDTAPPVHPLRWGTEVRSLDDVRTYADPREHPADRTPVTPVVTGIPNTRLAHDLGTLGTAPPDGLDPEELARAAEESGCAVVLRWSETGGPTCFDAVLVPRATDPATVRAHVLPPGTVPPADRAGPAADDEDKHVNVPFVTPRDARLKQSVTRRAEAFLPAVMVPSAVVVLDGFPRTPNGKLDRAALPAPDVAGSAGSRAPRTPREEALCRMYAELLGVDEVGIDDSFFDLGGHSLLVTRLISRIRVEFGIEVPITAVFDAPSVAALTERLPGARKARPALRRMRPKD